MVRASASLCVLFLGLALPACAKKAGHVTEGNVRLHASTDPSCAPGAFGELRVTALGDFPTTDQTVGILNAEGEGVSFDTFPLETHAFRVESDAMYASVRFPDDSGSIDMLLLPRSRTCRASDESIVGLPGAAIVATLDGTVLGIGGTIDDSAQRRVIRVSPGQVRPELLEVNDSLFSKRAFASATLTDEYVVVVGGEASASDDPEDSVEVYDLSSGRFDRDLIPTMFLSEGRSHHGSVELADGRVLVAGGRGASGLLASSEILDVTAGTVDANPTSLPSPRRDLHLVRLDDGSILGVGGELDEPGGGVHAFGDVLLFDMASQSFAPLSETLHFSPRASAAVVALMGDRVAYIGGTDSSGDFVDAIDVLYMDGVPRIARADLHNAACSESVFCQALREIHAAQLLDGRVLVTGIDASTGDAHLYVLDLNRGIASEQALLSPIVSIAVSSDGTSVLMSHDGVFVRRDTTLSPYDNPSTLFGGSLDGLALDDRAHWTMSGASLVASEDARVDVAALRYRDLTAEIESSR